MKRILIALLLLTYTALEAQNVTIDYQAWNPSNPPCNIFNTATNVPATGVASGVVQHQTMIGQPIYNTSIQSIDMATQYVSSSSSLGTRFRLAYNFKAGFSYNITVTVAADANTVGFPTSPFLRVTVNNNGGGGGTGCNGPQSVDPSAGGNPAAIQVPLNTFSDIPFSPFVQGSNQPTLELTATPAQNSNAGTKIIRLRKITIVETPPPPTFTLSPSPTLNVPLGTSAAQTFTVTNVYNSPGVTSYEWNLGSSANGWLFNGTAAPQNISTTTNTLTLTPDACANLSNVSVTVRINNANYTTLNCTVSRSVPSANTFSIAGPNEFCNTGNYSISGGSLCGATVSWSLGNLNNSPNVGSLSCTNCNTTTLTKINNGTAWLIATVTFPNNTTFTYEKYIGVGTPVFRGWYNSPTNSIEPMTPFSRWTNPGATNPACYTTFINTNTDITANATVVWSGGGTGVTWGQTGNNLQFYFSDINQTAVFTVDISNSCGTTTLRYRFNSVSENCSGGTMLRVMVSPNPAPDVVNVELIEGDKVKQSKDIRSAKITDKTGNIIKTFEFGSNSKKVNINVSNLKTDLYNISVFDGKQWYTTRFSKN